MTVSAAHVVRNFLQAVMSGEIAVARDMVCDDFVFRTPTHDGIGGLRDYFAAAEERAPFVRRFRILHQWEDGNEVSTLYELDLGTPTHHAAMRINEWHSVDDTRVASAIMVFDTNAAAVRALRGALQGEF